MHALCCTMQSVSVLEQVGSIVRDCINVHNSTGLEGE